MPDPIPFALPDYTDREIAAAADAIASGWVTTGPRTKQFEREFAEVVGATHAVALNSCTAAMHLALEAMGLGPEHEVIVPTLTFAATAEVVRYFGAKPVLVDCLEADHQIDPRAAAAAVTARTRAIMPVHFGGQPCDMDAILALKEGRNIAVIEDAAHAFPADYKGETVGHLGDITCFSFYATKTLATGEGGMATTDDETWADRMRVMSLHGMSKDAWKRYDAQGSWYYEIIAPGFKYNMGDIAAALGLVQLERRGELLERRRAIAARYREAFADIPQLTLPAVHNDRTHAWHLFVVRTVPEALTIDRGAFIEALKGRGVGTSVHFIPLHLHPYYRDTYGHGPGDFPVAEGLYSKSISLPIYSKMSDAQVDRVITAVTEIAAQHAQ